MVQVLKITPKAARLLTESAGQFFSVSTERDEFYYTRDCASSVHIFHRDDVIVEHWEFARWKAYCND